MSLIFLRAGRTIRFKGPDSDLDAEKLCDSLRGHCSRNGSKLVITKNCMMQVKLREIPSGFQPELHSYDVNLASPQ